MSNDDPRATLRAELRARRKALAADARIAAATAVAENLESLAEFLVDTRVGGYWAIDGELPLHAVVTRLQSRGQRYFLPRITGPRQLAFAEWRAGIALEANRYGIPEPVCSEAELSPAGALELVLVPLLGFDRSGLRIGYGGGYYDASFAALRERSEAASPLLVGVAYAAQELERIEPANWDVRLDYVVTERELIDCWASAA